MHRRTVTTVVYNVLNQYFFLHIPLFAFCLLLNVMMTKKAKSLNISNQCSVGIFLHDACFLSTFVPVKYSLKSIDNLSENLRKTICYRTNITKISSISRHHLLAFSSHFSKLKQSSKCSNPLNIHSVSFKSPNLLKA